MTSALKNLQLLRHVVVRLGVRPAGRYWSNELHVFASNLIGGAAAGASLSVLAAVLLWFDAHRGSNSLLYHWMHAALAVVHTIQAQIARELR